MSIHCKSLYFQIQIESIVFSNIWIDAGYNAKIVAHPNLISYTKEDEILRWLSPEHKQSRKLLPVEHEQKKDIWSFGLLIYFCITGEEPYQDRPISELRIALPAPKPNFNTQSTKINDLVTMMRQVCKKMWRSVIDMFCCSVLW